jgi:RNA polymerase-binding transcription factor DksA
VNNRIADAGAAPFSADDLAALRASLKEQRAFRLEQLERFTRPSRAGDALRRRSASQLEVQVKLSASARMVLSDVEAALERMDQGRYGVCHVCAHPISLERLTVVPQARYCGRCPRGGEAGR